MKDSRHGMSIKFPVVIKDYKPMKGYPNADRRGLILFVCQACKEGKLDCDLYQDTGLCGDCQFQQWEAERKIQMVKNA